MVNPSQHKPDRLKTEGAPPPPPPPLDPEHASRMAWLSKVRLMHRNKRLLGFAGIILGAALVLWARMTPDQAPAWTLMTGFAVLAVSWLLFIYVIFDRWRWVKKHPYSPPAPPDV